MWEGSFEHVSRRRSEGWNDLPGTCSLMLPKSFVQKCTLNHGINPGMSLGSCRRSSGDLGTASNAAFAQAALAFNMGS